MAATRASWIAKAAHLIEIFLASQKPATRAAYEVDLEAYRNHANAETIAEAIGDLLRLGPGAASGLAKLYKAALRNHYAATTVNRRLSCLRSLTRTARDLHEIDWRLRISDLKVTRSRNTAGPGTEAIKRMLDIAHRQGGTKGPRDKAIIWLLYGLGLRRGEVAAIDRQHVHLSARPPTIEIQAKGYNQPLVMGMPERVIEGVHGWIMHRGNHDGPLFTTMSRAHDRNERITDRGIGVVIKSLGRAVGVETTPHGLRHTAITDAVRRMPMPDAQAFSRHANLATLAIYYDHDHAAALDAATAITEAL